MIIKFDKYINEGVRDKMTPKSTEEVNQALDRISEGDYEKFLRNSMNMLSGILGMDYSDEVYNRILQEIDFNLLRKHLGSIVATVAGTRYNIIKRYRAKVRLVRTHQDIANIAYNIGDEIGDVGFRDNILIRLIMLNPLAKTKEIIRKLIVGDVNEGVRDKMTPRPIEEIKKKLTITLNKVMKGAKEECEEGDIKYPLGIGEMVYEYLSDEIDVSQIFEEDYDEKTDTGILILNPYIKEGIDELIPKYYPDWNKDNIKSFWVGFESDKEIHYFG